jgi:hypothetical protein
MPARDKIISMSEASIDLTDGSGESTLINIRLYDPATSDDIDVWEVEHEGEHYYFEAEEDCEMIDVILLAAQTIREN